MMVSPGRPMTRLQSTRSKLRGEGGVCKRHGRLSAASSSCADCPKVARGRAHPSSEYVVMMSLRWMGSHRGDNLSTMTMSPVSFSVGIIEGPEVCGATRASETHVRSRRKSAADAQDGVHTACSATHHRDVDAVLVQAEADAPEAGNLPKDAPRLPPVLREELARLDRQARP
jgi:hypothetical protein